MSVGLQCNDGHSPVIELLTTSMAAHGLLLLASLTSTMGEVVVETTRNLRPFRMYEDLPARLGLTTFLPAQAIFDC